MVTTAQQQTERVMTLGTVIMSPHYVKTIDNWMTDHGYIIHHVSANDPDLKANNITPDDTDFYYQNTTLRRKFYFIDNMVYVFQYNGGITSVQNRWRLVFRFTNPGHLEGFKSILRGYVLAAMHDFEGL